MEFEHKSGIYMCTCNINGRSYIGQSSDVKLRKCHHLSDLRGNRHFNQHLQSAYNKYKEYNFSWTVLEYCAENELDDREIYWIAYYNTYKMDLMQMKVGPLIVTLRERMNLSKRYLQF